jgi:hypothetical protein
MERPVRGGALLLILAAVGCGGSIGGAGGGGGGGGNTVAADCAKVPVANHTSGGCNIRLAQPIGCQTLDLTNGKTATLEWVTDGTTCETPWAICVGGSPSSFTAPVSNAGCVTINVTGTNVTSKTAIVTVSAADFAALTSTTGVYYWTVQNWSGSSYPATAAFRILK